MLSQSNKMNKRKSSDGFLSEGLVMECTPTESIMQFSPHHKHQRLLSMGKENDCNQFASHGTTFLTSCSSGSSSTLDESLWHSVDLEGLTHVGPALQQVLKNGMVLMDLSSSIIPSSSLESILSHCRLLEFLSLEALQLSDNIISCLSMNPNLLQLNLSGCSGFSAPALAHMLKDLGSMFPLLSLLDVFGIVNDSHLSSLKKELPRISINSRPFSSIARPSPSSGLTGGFMWNRKCQLRFKL
ncbi:hypothetical protein F7725_015068 [Dissostichus mawsoni]|uniref:S-phase kinase-associated protein 2 n=1 Tax=Dissostichus mawsoni TaxID=36200 RepID=A0A7J5YHX6_DISMA|nr:hypothetical protein F7725_015068 [Dissostichus mawsoni]